MHKRLQVLALGILCLGLGHASADGSPTLDELKSRILQEQNDTERRIVAFNRVRVGFPQRLSAATGWIFSRQPKHRDCRVVCPFDGWTVQVEPGWSGGQLAVGYASIRGETGAGNRYIRNPYLGWGIKGALLRSWNGADLHPPDQTLLGVEGEFTVIQLNFSLSLFREIGPGPADDDWIVGGGFGWGF